jgi:ABC-type transporter Mla subunit MlaD
MRSRTVKSRLFWVGLFSVLVLLALVGLLMRPFSAEFRPARS